MSTITKSNLEFLQNLKQHNNRDWFTNNKDVYEKQHAETILFADAVLNEIKRKGLSG